MDNQEEEKESLEFLFSSVSQTACAGYNPWLCSHLAQRKPKIDLSHVFGPRLPVISEQPTWGGGSRVGELWDFTLPPPAPYIIYRTKGSL